MNIAAAAFFLLTPALLLWTCSHYQWAQKVGAVALCYGAGLIVGNSGLLPDVALPLQKQVSEGSIAIALPLLMMTLNVTAWLRSAGKAILSMLLATVSVMTLATSLFYASSSANSVHTQEYSQMAAMSVGVYTGGTPNLAAIKAGLDIPHESYLVFHSLDTVLGAGYLILMLTIAIPFFRKRLQPPQSNATPNHTEKNLDNHKEDLSNNKDTPTSCDLTTYDDNYQPLLRFKNLPELLKAFVICALILGSALLITQFVQHSLGVNTSGALVIVLLTTFGIAASLIPAVRRLRLSYKLGMYWVYVFCFTVASMADINNLVAVDPIVLVFITMTILGSITLHALLCRLFKVDSDTFMVTSVAAICSPPFVPLMAKALNNSSLILSGMTTGIIGYALGNYLGIGLALFLQSQ
ncbi:DUF819 family protein [Aestuariicella sp. G3-2]|uniref:DUF819 family protein n=1 Tax=Pseudomaricurvus albidus TaxID=2842452 RepID=UPI001C0DD2BF|nr:DUF819 family protein [Aestuariicella albida]MBU3070283.1 DUF819 family protein [Aestuariicella albida]